MKLITSRVFILSLAIYLHLSPSQCQGTMEQRASGASCTTVTLAAANPSITLSYIQSDSLPGDDQCTWSIRKTDSSYQGFYVTLLDETLNYMRAEIKSQACQRRFGGIQRFPEFLPIDVPGDSLEIIFTNSASSWFKEKVVLKVELAKTIGSNTCGNDQSHKIQLPAGGPDYTLQYSWPQMVLSHCKKTTWWLQADSKVTKGFEIDLTLMEPMKSKVSFSGNGCGYTLRPQHAGIKYTLPGSFVYIAMNLYDDSFHAMYPDYSNIASLGGAFKVKIRQLTTAPSCIRDVCGGSLSLSQSKPSGVIQYPLTSSYYRGGQNCKWTISSDGSGGNGFVVVPKFLSVSKDRDVIQLSDGKCKFSITDATIGQNIEMKGNQMTLNFITNYPWAGSSPEGIKIEVKRGTVTGHCAGCGGTVTLTSQDTVKTIRYPTIFKNYGNKDQCEWKIVNQGGAQGFTIEMKKVEFDKYLMDPLTLTGTQCTYNMERGRINSPFDIKGNSLTLTLNSDAKFTGGGFEMKIVRKDIVNTDGCKDCGGDVHLSGDNVATLYSSKVYGIYKGGGQPCVYNLIDDQKTAQGFNINFNKLDLDRDATLVINGKSCTQNMKYLTSAEIPGQKATITFTPGRSNRFSKGFIAGVQLKNNIVQDTCEENLPNCGATVTLKTRKNSIIQFPRVVILPQPNQVCSFAIVNPDPQNSDVIVDGLFYQVGFGGEVTITSGACSKTYRFGFGVQYGPKMLRFSGSNLSISSKAGFTLDRGYVLKVYLVLKTDSSGTRACSAK